MTAQQFDALLLDLDGTLVDTLGDFVAALNAMLEDLLGPGSTGPVVALQAEDVALMVGKGSEHLVQQALRRVESQLPIGLDRPDPPSPGGLSLSAQALNRYLHHYARLNGLRSSLYPGVQASLSRWHHAGLPLVCLTNKPERFARDLLRQKNCLDFFEHVIGGDTYEKKKPHPMPLLKACERLGTLPEHTCMVGDSVNDVQAARAAGCPVILVCYGYNHGQPAYKAGADRVIDSLEDLL
jgi:phosphoglycolate phosphatase